MDRTGMDPATVIETLVTTVTESVLEDFEMTSDEVKTFLELLTEALTP